MRRIIRALTTVVVCSSLAAAVNADEEGNTFISFASPPTVKATQLPDGKTHALTEASGFTVADDPASVFNKLRITCRITIVEGSGDEGVIFEYVTCDAVDLDGDMVFMYGKADAPAPAVLSLVGGTGKFAGATGEIDTAGASDSYAEGSAIFPWTVKWIKLVSSE